MKDFLLNSRKVSKICAVSRLTDFGLIESLTWIVGDAIKAGTVIADKYYWRHVYERCKRIFNRVITAGIDVIEESSEV